MEQGTGNGVADKRTEMIRIMKEYEGEPARHREVMNILAEEKCSDGFETDELITEISRKGNRSIRKRNRFCGD